LTAKTWPAGVDLSPGGLPPPLGASASAVGGSSQPPSSPAAHPGGASSSGVGASVGSQLGSSGVSPASPLGPPSLVGVPWVITEVNGRPLNLFPKDNEAAERLQVSSNGFLEIRKCNVCTGLKMPCTYS